MADPQSWGGGGGLLQQWKYVSEDVAIEQEHMQPYH